MTPAAARIRFSTDPAAGAPLRVLMLAPQPFFRARGTPVSILHRVQALRKLGHHVDLVTYPFGENPNVDCVGIHRTPRPPGIRDVPIGPSVAKAILDIPFFFAARRALRSGTYDVLHTHEEACAMGAWLSRRFGVPHLYDMHSSLPQQFDNFGRFDWPPVVAAFRRLERYTLDRSDAVIAICPSLGDHARQVGYTGPLAIIENSASFQPEPATDAELRELRRELGVAGARLVVYTGSFEHYQGLDLLVRAATRVAADMPNVRFVLVGGDKRQIQELQGVVREAGAEKFVVLVQRVPPERVARYLEAAEVLVTARTRGTNTPLKIYQYLRAGRPIVATDVRSHIQVLDPRCAELVRANPGELAAGLVRVLSDPRRSATLAETAGRIARERYSEEAYVEALAGILAHVRRASPPAAAARL